MDKIKVFKEKLAAFNNAFQDLDNFMQYSTGLDDSFAQNYPFDCEFDEMSLDVKQWVQSVGDHCPTLKCKNTASDQSIDYARLLKIEWDKYDAVFIHESTAFDENDQPLPYKKLRDASSIRVIEKESDYVSTYSVFINSEREHGLEVIGEFKELEDAKDFEQLILRSFLVNAVNHVQFKLDCTAIHNVDVNKLKQKLVGAIRSNHDCMSLMNDFGIDTLEK